MRKTIFICTAIWMAVLMGAARAEFYQYRDAQGNIVFTDDMSQVPEDQLPRMTTHESVAPSATQTRAPQPESASAGTQTPSVESKAAPVRDKDLDALRDWLLEKKEELDREKAALEAMKPNINTPKDQEAYNNKVKAINAKIDVYKEKLAIYNQKIQALE